MCGKLPWKQKMSMLDASWCIEWLTVYDLTELVLCCLLTVGNATSGGGNVKKRKVRQAASISGHILSTKEHTKKKNTLHLASLWHESPTSGAWRVNMSEHCQTQTQSQQAVYRIEQKWWKQETNENSASWCPSQLTVSSIESIVLSAVLFTCALHCKRIQDKTKHGKVPQLNWPFHGKAHKERKSLSCFWLGLDARQKSDEISS